MAYNVLGWRRFAGPDKGLRSKARAGKMWWSKTPQRAYRPAGVLRNPSRLLAAKRQPIVMRSLAILYCLPHRHIIL